MEDNSRVEGMGKGFTLPITPILIVLIAVLAYFFGWIVLVVVVGVVALITAGTAIFDRLSHAHNCRYCNQIKEVLSAQKGIAQDRITTKHEKDYSDHMLVRTYIDGNIDILVDIDFNGELIDWPLGASQELDSSRSRPSPDKARWTEGRSDPQKSMLEDELTKPYRVFLLDTAEEYEELIERMNRAIALNPHDGVALNNRGVAFWEIGSLEEALDDLAMAIEVMPQSGVPYVNRADILKKLTRVQESLEHYDAAIELEPDNPYFLRGRAHLLHELGRFEDAVADYDIALEIQPEFGRTHEDRRRALAQLPPVE